MNDCTKQVSERLTDIYWDKFFGSALQVEEEWRVRNRGSLKEKGVGANPSYSIFAVYASLASS